MDFRILGALEVLDEGSGVALGGDKQRALLALLLLHANETLTTERLIDELEGGRPRATAAKAVQVRVSRLRKALEGGSGNGAGGLIETREHGYRLEIDPNSIDAHRFERLLAEGRNELAAGRPRRAASALETALSLWRGPPLADLEYEPFVQPEIGRLNDLRVDALEELVEAKLALGRHAEVVGTLERLIAEHPYRERLRAQLMLALYRCERQADALQAYQDARAKLVEELGIEPGERLRELERAILAQDPALAITADGPAGAEPAAGTPRGAFVGRERELAELVAGLDDAFAGSGRLFLLVGEPGIGKSRLAEELIARARDRGARVLVGRCWESGGAPAYWPWVQSLRAYVRESDTAALRSQLGPGAADLAQIIPDVRRRFPELPEPPLLEPEAARFRLFDATAEFLRRASESRPIVLALDDLHAADTPSLLLLHFLARELGSARILLLGAYRDVDPVPGQALTAMLAEVTREPGTRRLSLGGLSEPEVAEYVGLTAPEIASAHLVTALHADSEGNPLFVGEIVRLLAVEGVPRESGAEGALAIPQTIRDVITRRLAHLPEETNRVLLLASVLGREFALAPLAHMSGLPEEELLEALDEAIAARVVFGFPGGLGRLRFAHTLIRETLYERLTTARRVRLHRLVVEALEALHGGEPGPYLAELAHHATAGSDFDRALRYARRAGDRALALLAYEESARLYEAALEALDLVGAQEETARCDLLISLGEAESRAGNMAAARGAFLDAAGIAGRLGLARELARAAAGYGGRIPWARAADDDRLVPLLEAGLAALASEDVELRPRLLARLAGALRDEHARDRRDILSREAVELARRRGNATALADALYGRAAAIFAPDTVAECRALGSELREIAERIDDPERVMHGLMTRFIAQVMVGAISEAEADLESMGRVADHLRQPAQLWRVCVARATLALAAGRLSEAEELVSEALVLGARAQPDMAIPIHRLQRCALCDLRETLEEAEPAICDVVAAYPRPAFRCLLAHVHARLGQLPQAKAELDDLARDDFSALPFDMEWLYGMSLLAETSALLGDAHSASTLYRLLAPWAAFNAADHPEGFRGSVSRYLGILATTTKRWQDAERHFEDALAANQRMGARPWLAHTQHDYARMLLGRGDVGDRGRALELVGDALATYRELGMESWAEKASELEQTARFISAAER
jgi:DNA-binding SARP family transcriptional activator